jgi:hypothetical protein
MTPVSGTDTDSLELQRLRDDAGFREREIAIKEREQTTREGDLQLKAKELARSRWSNPLLLAIVAAFIAALSNAGVAWYSNGARRELDKNKFEADRILEAIKTNSDPDKAAINLAFLVKAGLVSNPDVKVPLEKYLAGRTKGEGAALPGGQASTVHPSAFFPSPGGGMLRCDFDPQTAQYVCRSIDRTDASSKPGGTSGK